MLKPVTRAEWIAALRSGRYPQSTYGWQNAAGKEYCCLRVLSAEAHGGVDPLELTPIFDKLRSFSAYPLSDYVIGECLDRNDTGSTFAEIADYLEGLPTT